MTGLGSTSSEIRKSTTPPHLAFPGIFHLRESPFEDPSRPDGLSIESGVVVVGGCEGKSDFTKKR